MCGLFGIIQKSKNTVNVKHLEAGIDLLSHRGPDSRGSFTDSKVAFGHTRLAIFDTSDKGSQPMTAFGCHLIFNGAIYNYIEIREELVKKGYSFRSNSDTEVVLAAFAEYGLDCFKLFNGQWAIAIYDPAKRKVILSRDRIGIKPIYFYENDDAFYFCSEIKALSTIPRFERQVDVSSMADFLAYKMHDHTSNTFYRGVSNVKKGNTLIYDLEADNFKETQFYNLEHIQYVNENEDTLLSTYSHLLDSSIKLRLRSDRPIGMALSGGLDSSILALRISNVFNKKNVSTYSVVYESEKINEKKYLEAVVKSARLENSIIAPDERELLDLLPNVLYHQEEPFNGFGVMAQNVLFRKASSDGVKVMIDGQGADELLGGYEKFYLPIIKKLSKSNPFQALLLLNEIMFKTNFGLKNAYKAFRNYSRKNIENKPGWLIPDPLQRYSLKYPEDTVENISKNLLNGMGISALLRYEDKNAMQYGIESRVPYLDHKLVEFSLQLTDNYKINKDVRKWILREANKSILPSVLYNRKNKLGFATPEKYWLRNNEAYYIKQIDKYRDMLKAFIDFDKLKLEGNSDLIWRLFIAGKWMDELNLKH